MPAHRTALSAAALATAALFALTGCSPEDVGVDSKGTASASAGSDGGGSSGVSPLENPDGTKRGLAPIGSPRDKAAARKVIDKVRTAGRGPRTGFERGKFGYAWMDTADGVPLARNGCDTRNDVLARDGEDLRRRSGSDCVLASMELNDPYTGRTIEWRKQQAIKVQIDHVMPLSYDWQMGAARWNEAKRKQIANDPLNLIPVDGPTNGSKSDSGPAAWLPPSKRIRCSYSVRFAQVSLKYDLPVTAPDKRMMLTQCGG
ncbi:HNH endonuclease family protein [Streptomyces sp. H27-D2]|uniref:HNH endonuclease family protein n=1 Tax=Streptomyces sp. H27-D2 TaxID=3046304 RepID=UPI003FA79467